MRDSAQIPAEGPCQENKETRLGRSGQRVNKSLLEAFTTRCALALGEFFFSPFRQQPLSSPQRQAVWTLTQVLLLHSAWSLHKLAGRASLSSLCPLLCGIRIAQNLTVSSAWCLLSEVSERIPYTSIKETHFKMGTGSKVTMPIKTALSWFTNIAAHGVLSKKYLPPDFSL